LLKLSAPIFLSRVSFVVMKTTNSSMLGHVGTRYLNAAALSDLWTSSTGVVCESYVVGMFCGQAFGAGNKRLVGAWLQVSLVVALPLCVLVVVAWCFTSTVLRAFGKGEKIAADAGYYTAVLALCLPVRIVFSQASLFFTAQGLLAPSSVACAGGMTVNLVLGLVFVFGVAVPRWTGGGFLACPWVTTCAEYVQLALMWYLFCHRWHTHEECWPGWSWSHVTRERLQIYLRQFVPQTLSLASDFWRVSATGAIASSLGDDNVAVWYTGYCICSITLTLSGSLASAMSVQLGIALGVGNAVAARRHTSVGVTLCLFMVCLLSLVVACFPRLCAGIFSSDPVFLDLFSKTRFPFAAFVGLMNLAVVLERIPVTVGRPRVTFWMGVVGSWAGQVPGALLCTRVWRGDLVGLYTGSALGYALLCVLLASACLTFDWDELTAEAHVRSEVPQRSGIGDKHESELTHDAVEGGGRGV